MANEQVLEVRATLEGEDVAKFTAIKQHYGVAKDAEVFRICLTQVYRTILKEKTTEETA